MNIVIEAPQAIYLAFWVVGMFTIASRIGTERVVTTTLVDLLVYPAVGMGLLIWGGFFG